jgi:hypothetical protein
MLNELCFLESRLEPVFSNGRWLSGYYLVITRDQILSFFVAVTSPRAIESGFDSRQGQEIFYSPQRRDRFWSQPSLVSNGHRGLFPRD